MVVKRFPIVIVEQYFSRYFACWRTNENQSECHFHGTRMCTWNVAIENACLRHKIKSQKADHQRNKLIIIMMASHGEGKNCTYIRLAWCASAHTSTPIRSILLRDHFVRVVCVFVCFSLLFLLLFRNSEWTMYTHTSQSIRFICSEASCYIIMIMDC